IADVLQVDVQLLLGKDAERRPGNVNCIDQVEVEEIRAALERYDQISPIFQVSPEPPALDELRKALGHAWLTFQHAKYGVLGRARPALEVNVNVANRLAPGAGTEPTRPERLSVYGMLLLNGAMAAARIGDSATVRDLIRGADDAAIALGEDRNDYWTSFGPTNVQLHRAAAAVELGEGRLAIETHERMDQGGFMALLPERRAHHFIDLARGLAQIGDVARASEMLLEGDRLAPSEIRCRPIAHEVLS